MTDLVGQDEQRLSLFSFARFDLSHDHRTHVLILVDNGHNEGAVDEANHRWQVVDEGYERTASEPWALAGIQGFLQASASQTRAGHERQVFERVEAQLLQIRKQFFFALVVPLRNQRKVMMAEKNEIVFVTCSRPSSLWDHPSY